MNYKKQIYSLARVYDVDVVWDKELEGGTFRSPRTINIGCKTRLSADDYLSIMFHELGHVWCYRNNIWEFHHKCHTLSPLGLKVERWVDRWGKAEMAKWYPKSTYSASYYTKGGVEWFKSKVADLKSRYPDYIIQLEDRYYNRVEEVLCA